MWLMPTVTPLTSIYFCFFNKSGMILGMLWRWVKERGGWSRSLSGWGSNDFITKMARVLTIQREHFINSLCGHIGVSSRPDVPLSRSHQWWHSGPSPQLWIQTSGRCFCKQNLPSKEKICHHLGNSVSEGGFKRKFPKRFSAVTGLSYSFFKGSAGWEHRNSGMFIQRQVLLFCHTSWWLIYLMVASKKWLSCWWNIKSDDRLPDLFGEP